MQRRILLAGAALLAWTAPAARAHRDTVALLPARVFQGDKLSGPVVMDALHDNLERHGFTVLSRSQVENALRSLHVDLSYPQSIMTMRRLRDATGADYVVYPRVLGVGMGIRAANPQATIMVNVLGRSNGGYIHSWQVGQEFKPQENPTDPGAVVIDPETAGKAAARLMSGFYARIR